MFVLYKEVKLYLFLRHNVPLIRVFCFWSLIFYIQFNILFGKTFKCSSSVQFVMLIKINKQKQYKNSQLIVNMKFSFNQTKVNTCSFI
jgi:hypothetical protein